MSLLLFLVKIAVSRIIYFVKHYTVIVIGAAVIILSFIVAKVDTVINLDTEKTIAIAAVLMSVSLVVSLKNYNVTPMAIAFSKSGLMNKNIYRLFFINKSIVNNMTLFLLNLIILRGMITVERFIYIPVITMFSLLSCFLLMNIKHTFVSKKIGKKKVKKARIPPLVKSTVCDYFTSGFFEMALIGVFLFGAILFELLKDRDAFQEMDNLFVIFIELIGALSFGFMGILDSIPHTNWKYYAIVSPYNFSRHFGRVLLFLTGFFGIFIMLFIVIASYFNAMLMLKYLFCMIILMSLSINIAFTTGSILTKTWALLIVIALTLWISRWPAYFLLILLIPLLVSLVKAKTEYNEWYLL
jgi:hypothetical protein